MCRSGTPQTQPYLLSIKSAARVPVQLRAPGSEINLNRRLPLSRRAFRDILQLLQTTTGPAGLQRQSQGLTGKFQRRAPAPQNFPVGPGAAPASGIQNACGGNWLTCGQVRRHLRLKDSGSAPARRAGIALDPQLWECRKRRSRFFACRGGVLQRAPIGRIMTRDCSSAQRLRQDRTGGQHDCRAYSRRQRP